MWSVIILGLIKMLLKTVSFDHRAAYLISEEHNLGKKHHKYKGSEPEQHGDSGCGSGRNWNPLRAELQLCPSANSWNCCHEMSLRAELHQIPLCFNRERSHQRFK